MEELAEPHRASAWITIEDGSLANEEMKQIYEKHWRSRSWRHHVSKVLRFMPLQK
jgi:hypothetical protein